MNTNHETYDRLAAAAKAGKPVAVKAIGTIERATKSAFRFGKQNGTPLPSHLIEEALAEAAVEASPWLKIALDS